MKNKALESVLVFIQFTTIAYVYLSTNWISIPYWCWTCIAIAGILAVWAIATMQLKYLRIQPSPLENTRLVKSGPYRVIRHPMYTSLLIMMFPPIIAEYSLLRLSLGILLLIDLLVKLNYEEKLLTLKFPEYKEYREQTNRLIPFLY